MRPPPLRLRRLIFWAYAAVLFVGTHFPQLRVPGTGRPDLLVHLVAFGLWTSLLIAAEFLGPILSWRNLGRAAVVAALYAAADEALQGLPFLGRVAALDDWCANLLGVLLATLAAASLRLVFPRTAPDAAASAR